MKRLNTFKPKAKIHIHTPSSSSDDQFLDLHTGQAHGRIRSKHSLSPLTTDTSTSVSKTSLTESINRFRTDFDELKCKMRIFGESLNLCKCIASDFRTKVLAMDSRLENLEKRQKVERSESNYSAIIQKNKFLSFKTLRDAKLERKSTKPEKPSVSPSDLNEFLKIKEPSNKKLKYEIEHLRYKEKKYILKIRKLQMQVLRLKRKVQLLLH